VNHRPEYDSSPTDLTEILRAADPQYAEGEQDPLWYLQDELERRSGSCQEACW
jgi:hypothetical protein